MNDITVEKKLELVQQMRSQYSKNQYDMSNRERILYGQSRTLTVPHEKSAREESPSSSFGLRVRILAAAALLAAAILLDQNHIEIAGIAMEKVFTAISTDYYGVVSEYIEQTILSFS